jgi:hypothetical protein
MALLGVAVLAAIGLVILAGVGCTPVERLRQGAVVQRLRAEQDRERAQAIMAITGQVQDATRVVIAALDAEEHEPIRSVVQDVRDAQEIVVTHAAAIEQSTNLAEKWGRATERVLGEPRVSVRPGTPEEETALADFSRAAQTLGALRAARSTIGNLFGPSPLAGQSAGGAAVPGAGYAAAGLIALLTGGGGTMLIRRLLQRVSALGQTSEAHQTEDRQRDQRTRDLEDQMERLSEGMDLLQARIAQAPAVPPVPQPLRASMHGPTGAGGPTEPSPRA